VKALIWHGGSDLRLEEAADPVAAADEVVLEVELAGICGSDLHAYRGHPGPRKPPLVLGHEVVGRLDGDRYTVYPLLGCGVCARCLAGEDNLCPDWRLIGIHLPGVFAEQVLVPRRSLVSLPAGLDARHAVLSEPLACCVGALAPCELTPETRLVVLGCGPIGLLSIYAAARAGAHVSAVDPVAERRTIARRLGAEEAVSDAEELEPSSADVVIDAAGFAATWRSALTLVAHGGSIVVLGLGDAEAPFPMATLVRRSIVLRGQFAYSRADFAAAVELLSRGELDLDWLSETPLLDGAQAFADLTERPDRYQKVLLKP
jgi:threonine dehydrogenase-like Zn-dependent dehydrogenase